MEQPETDSAFSAFVARFLDIDIRLFGHQYWIIAPPPNTGLVGWTQAPTTGEAIINNTAPSAVGSSLSTPMFGSIRSHPDSTSTPCRGHTCPSARVI